MNKMIITSLLSTSLALTACGGGGGGPDYTGAGNVTLKVSQELIDTGDRSKVTVSFDELHPDGVVLKMRYASGLEYIDGTSSWKIGGKVIAAAPSYEVAGDVAQSIFLVYNLGRDILVKNNSGELVFELRGVEETSLNSVVEVDMDVFEESQAFSAESPEFSEEYSTKLVVK